MTAKCKFSKELVSAIEVKNAEHVLNNLKYDPASKTLKSSAVKGAALIETPVKPILSTNYTKGLEQLNKKILALKASNPEQAHQIPAYARRGVEPHFPFRAIRYRVR